MSPTYTQGLRHGALHTLAILREQKQPAEQRAPLSPEQVAELLAAYPGLQVLVQPCIARCFADGAYLQAGALVQEDVSTAQVLLGIKERKPDTLVAGAHYLFFSHTIKGQPANRALLQAVLEARCRLTDYECITDQAGGRLVAFGHFAGVVGALHALRMVGMYTGRFAMPAPGRIDSVQAALATMPAGALAGQRIVVTGQGRVSAGAVAVLEAAGVRRLSPAKYLAEPSRPTDEPVFCQLTSQQLYRLADGTAWQSSAHFYANAERYDSGFEAFLPQTDMLITGAYWGPGYPRLFSTQALADPASRLRLIADVSCDIAGGVPVTLRPSTILEPYYDVDPITGLELPAFCGRAEAVTVMAVDNLPCEMPAEASRHFGRQLLDHFISDLLADGPLTARATIAQGGRLTPTFQYLDDYVHALVGS